MSRVPCRLKHEAPRDEVFEARLDHTQQGLLTEVVIQDGPAWAEWWPSGLYLAQGWLC